MKQTFINKARLWVLEPFGAGRFAQRPDFVLLTTIGGLFLFGLLMLSSASTVIAFQEYGDSYFFLKRQLINGFIPGIILFLVALKLPYQIWKKLAFWMLIISLGLLVLVIIPGIGVAHGGAQRWLSIAGIDFQPSEIVKITFLIYLATWLEKKGKHGLQDIEYGTIPFLTVLGTIALLILLQPDLGTLLVIMAMSFALYYLAGAPWKHIGVISAMTIGIIIVLMVASPYRAQRLQTFFGGGDALGGGYHISQAKIAIGSGGLFGLGLGHSKQKFKYLPEVQGDSIFAIIAEEMGFVIGTLVIAGFIVLLLRGLRVARGSPDDFGRFLASGITVWFVFQALVNMAAMMNLVPLTGITLPFISYGGSSLAISFFAIGILLNISKQSKLPAV
ncbi:MAG: putative lipid II flippase FtsW [Candidatus Komeilibacteria bacterium]|nr:putative lipid II flippase FtsW [Candidatus Komeilibacteria bacterium]